MGNLTPKQYNDIPSQIISAMNIQKAVEDHIEKYENVSIGNTNSMLRLDELQSLLEESKKQ